MLELLPALEELLELDAAAAPPPWPPPTTATAEPPEVEVEAEPLDVPPDAAPEAALLSDAAAAPLPATTATEEPPEVEVEDEALAIPTVSSIATNEMNIFFILFLFSETVPWEWWVCRQIPFWLQIDNFCCKSVSADRPSRFHL